MKINLEDCICGKKGKMIKYILHFSNLQNVGKVFSYDLEWFDHNLKRMKQNLSELDFDYVIFDFNLGRNLFSINTIILSNRIFIVMRPDEYSYEGTKILIEKFNSNIDLMKDKNCTISLTRYQGMRKSTQLYLNGFKN